MTARELDVLIAGVRAGTLSLGPSGGLGFRYARDYRGIPLSSAMPLSTATFLDRGTVLLSKFRAQ